MQKIIEEVTGNPAKEIKAQIQDEDNATHWRDHIIICGLNELGFRIMEQLRAAEVQVVMVDDRPDPRLRRQVQRMGIKLIQDDSRIPETLIDAGIYQAAALIACEDRDLHNFETVLVANDVVPGIRAVASFFNQKVGEQLTRAVTNAKALSLSEKAGPSFVEACVPSSLLHFFTIEGEQMAVVEAKISGTGAIEQLFGSNIPLVVRNAEPGTERQSLSSLSNNYSLAKVQPTSVARWELCPPRDYRVQPDQIVTLVGRVEELKQLPDVKLSEKDVLSAKNSLEAIQPEQATGQSGSAKDKDKKKSKREARRERLVARITKFRHLIMNVMRNLDRPLRYTLMCVGGLMVFCTIFLLIFYRSYIPNPVTGGIEAFTPIDALYFTVTILATVGFGDYNFAQQEWWLKVFGIVLTLLGTASISLLYAFVTNYIISRRIEEAMGRNRATNMENHIIICGLGSVGYQVMQGLIKQGRQVVVIEKSEQARFNSEARNQEVPIIYGDAKLPEVLKAVNIHKAHTIAILTSDDLANLETALSAHAEFHTIAANQNKRLQVVLRVFDNSLAERVAKNFDIHTIYSAAGLAAPYFVGAALDYEVVSTFYLDRRPFIVIKLMINEISQVDGMTVQQLYEATRMWVIAHSSQGMTGNGRQTAPRFHPAGGHELKGGDTIYCTGPYNRVIAAYRMNKQPKSENA